MSWPKQTAVIQTSLTLPQRIFGLRMNFPPETRVSGNTTANVAGGKAAIQRAAPDVGLP